MGLMEPNVWGLLPSDPRTWEGVSSFYELLQALWQDPALNSLTPQAPLCLPPRLPRALVLYVTDCQGTCLM